VYVLKNVFHVTHFVSETLQSKLVSLLLLLLLLLLLPLLLVCCLRCFADTKPRVFDTSSLQVLINFSELVSREMEREIVLAKQQYQQQQQQQQAAAAAAAVIPLDGVGGVPLQRQRLVERYQLLLRSIDCVARCVCCGGGGGGC